MQHSRQSEPRCSTLWFGASLALVLVILLLGTSRAGVPPQVDDPLPGLQFDAWQICGPFPLAEENPVQDEVAQLSAVRKMPSEHLGSHTWRDVAEWSNDAEIHFVDHALHQMIGRAFWFARRRFVCDKPTEAYWYIGADDHFTAWLDRRFVGEFRYQVSCQERRTCHRVILASGPHELLLKIDNLEGVSSFFSLFEPIAEPRAERHRLIRAITRFPRPGDPVGPYEMLRVGSWKRIPTNWVVPYSLLFQQPILDPETEIRRLQQILRTSLDLDSRASALYRLMEFYRDLGLKSIAQTWLLRLSKRRGQERGDLGKAALETAHRGDLASAAHALWWAHALEPANRLLIDRLLLCDRHWYHQEEAFLVHGLFWDQLAEAALKHADSPRTLVTLALGDVYHARPDRVCDALNLLNRRFPDTLESLDFQIWKSGIEQNATEALALYHRFLAAERRVVRNLQTRLLEPDSGVAE